MKVSKSEVLASVRKRLDESGVEPGLRNTGARSRVERGLIGMERIFEDKAIQSLINTKHDKSEDEIKTFLLSTFLFTTRDLAMIRLRLRWFLPFNPGTGMRTALALSGGGAKGSFECGVLAYLAKLQGTLRLAAVSGTSVGAVNALPLAELGWNGCPKLARIYLSLSDNRDFFVPSIAFQNLSDFVRQETSVNLVEVINETFDTDQPFPESNQVEVATRVLAQAALIPFPFSLAFFSSLASEVLQAISAFFDGQTGLFSLSPVRSLVRQNVDFGSIGQNGVRLFLCCTNNNTGEPCYVDEARQLTTIETGFAVGQTLPPDDALLDAAIASAAIPIIFEAQQLRRGTTPTLLSDFYVDGGLREVLPIEVACQPNVDLVIGVSASAIDSIAQAPGRPSIPGQVGRFIELALYDIGKNDKIVAQLKFPDQPFLFVQPVPHLEVHNSFTIDPGLIRINMAYGYMTAYLSTAILTGRWPSLDAGTAIAMYILYQSIIERRKTIHSLERKAPQWYAGAYTSNRVLFWNTGVVESLRQHKRQLVKEVDAYYDLCGQDPDCLPVDWATDTMGRVEHISQWWKGWEGHKNDVDAFATKGPWDLLPYNYLGLTPSGAHDAPAEDPPVSQYFR